MTLSSKLSFRYRLFRYALPYRWYALRCRILEWRHPGYLEKVRKADVEPVFIVGAGRSGNTLLARLLHETGGAHFGPENFTLCETYLAYLQCIDAPWETRVNRILSLLIGQKESWRWEKVDADAVRAYLLASDEHTLGNIIHAWYLHYGKAIGYPSERWGCKTPNLTPFIGHFMKVFPRARIVQVLREPGYVVASFSKAGIKPYDEEVMGYVHWAYFNDFMKNVRGKKVVRFSEMTADPQRVIPPLIRELEIQPAASPVVFDNPDLVYNHLGNVNAGVEKRDLLPFQYSGLFDDVLRELKEKYESY